MSVNSRDSFSTSQSELGSIVPASVHQAESSSTKKQPASSWEKQKKEEDEEGVEYRGRVLGFIYIFSFIVSSRFTEGFSSRHSPPLSPKYLSLFSPSN